ncbi:MAG: putative sigma54 specific transcriptional regulator with sensor [Anaerospora sp.]|nr:putative sigma54 specific transcriptional regulator with sensor [Anaerospora sp.]
MTVTRWLLKTDDRIGMIKEVSQIFSHEAVSIISMEVSTGQIFIKFFLEDDPLHTKNNLEELLRKELLKHKDIKSISSIALQPQEQREKELQTVLEFANDGIIGLSTEGAIRYINSAAAQLLRVDKNTIIGKNITSFIGENTLFDELLSGKSFDHQQMLIQTPRGTLHYLCSGRPIQDENEQFVGAVATLKSMKSAKQLVNSMMKNTKFEFKFFHGRADQNCPPSCRKQLQYSHWR